MTFMINHGGSPATADNRFISFRELSIFQTCKDLLEIDQPWMFTLNATHADRFGVPYIPSIAKTVVVSKMDKVIPDVANIQFFEL
eukprot:CAMPEP_0196762270 /NCGR_PEP_ID=MMETSP1095-20130614/1681_1 /TAXON_ID=96789 ORGANISM="Chromulina nebulosa, Strain UTEXLB2642" /NCGR_SAMPLE_ID=MMETSP1095 /ASSEMBLY_ACC=CAM_ASM_000446 /LENGTH=84 /DNA_ID=CAMNT_0042112853 /DNA_START=292 /DNA_END=546 /DNA_ORIENTATION=+